SRAHGTPGSCSLPCLLLCVALAFVVVAARVRVPATTGVAPTQGLVGLRGGGVVGVQRPKPNRHDASNEPKSNACWDKRFAISSQYASSSSTPIARRPI